MEENVSREYEEAEIDLGRYWAALRPNWWKIAFFSLGVGILTLLYMFTKPNLYKASATITPSADESRQNPALGAIASFGIQVGGPSKVEDLESLFKSNDLTVRVFRKYNLWPIVFADKFDPATGTMKPGWMDRLFGNEKGRRPPGDWDAIRAAKDRLVVSVNRRTGTLDVSFESPSPEGSANIVRDYLEEARARLQEEAFDRANKNKKFIQEQIARTVDALTRDRLYTLYGQEVEREMLARNREQFGFRVIDAPRVPDRKSRPARGTTAVAATLLSAMAFFVFFVVRDRRQAVARGGEGKAEPLSS